MRILSRMGGVSFRARLFASTYLMLFSAPVHACSIRAQQNLQDINYADVVLVGRILNYKVVRDDKTRIRRLKLINQRLAQTDLTPGNRKYYENEFARYTGPTSLLSDYARFDVLVDEVLVGNVGAKVSVIWDNSTFGEPKEMKTGPFLIALRQPNSKIPPLRGPSATILPSPEPSTLTVLQAPCSSPFIFEMGRKEIVAVRKILITSP